MLYIENNLVKVGVLPEQGGKVCSFVRKSDGKEYIWFDTAQAAKYDPKGEYDPQFSGGIDELLPSDIEEQIDCIKAPDHGELWRISLTVVEHKADSITMEGALSCCPLVYRRTMTLDGMELKSTAEIKNLGSKAVHFLWKLHGAIAVKPGDAVVVPAKCKTAAEVDWSTLPDAMPH